MRAVTCATLALFVQVAFAQTEEPPAHGSTGKAVPIEVFKGPQQKRIVLPPYPLQLRDEGIEGWVNVTMMIDPNGKPYEAMVSQSSGNKTFEKVALAAVDDWKFEPASLNGKPIDSSFELKVRFTLANPEKGAATTFVRAYKTLKQAFEAKDRPAAEAAMAHLSITNLYEDAFYGLAQYRYAQLWGNKLGELEGLKRAVAEEKTAVYLPSDTFIIALEKLFIVQAELQDYGGAMHTWDKLKWAKADAKTLAALKPVVVQMDKLRLDGLPYAVDGVLTDGSWYLALFKRHFRVVVSSGHVSQVKLRCDKNYVFFAFDPELTYNVADRLGACSIQLVGDPETKFQLIQS